MLANYDFDDLMNLTFLLSISKVWISKFILVSLLGADDLRRPSNQAKLRTSSQFGTTYWFDKARRTIANKSTWGTSHPMRLVS